ncbi:MAG: aspartate aminotransferase family protein [Myxococcota bacterium]|nr:aspartate aminotransferase family protein [Myxococcota bacterium]
MKNFMTPNYAPAPFILTHGEGTKVWDMGGKEYLDFTSGIAVNSLGHAHPRVVEAIREQTGRLSHVSNMFHHEGYLKLCKKLCELSFGEMVFLCNSGAEATEASIKLARKFFHRRGENRPKLIAFEGGFHGRTYGALSLTQSPKAREGFGPFLPDITHVSYDDLEAVSRAIDQETAAVFIEPIQGNTGVRVPTPGFFKGLEELCRKSGVLLVADEIQTGCGRTGRWFGYQHEDVTPDIMPLAKAMGGGLPLGAVVTSKPIGEALALGIHGSTFGGNPLACASGLTTLEVIEDENLIRRAEMAGRAFINELREIQKSTEIISAVRGRGLMIGLELTTKAKPILVACRESGLLITVAGPKVLRILPPLTTSDLEFTKALEILKKVVSTAHAT